jgi:LemA protein
MKNKGLIVVLVVLGLVVVLAIWAWSINNRLVALDEKVNAGWAQVETVLQRRYDLIPNLVETVKGYAAHEKELFEEVARLRSQWMAANTVDQKVAAAGALDAGLARLLLVAENYPQLQASQGFRDLHASLEGTENRISVERQRYNEAVRDYNTRVRSFPDRLMAGMLGFAVRDEYFQADKGAEQAPKVDFQKKPESAKGEAN